MDACPIVFALSMCFGIHLGTTSGRAMLETVNGRAESQPVSRHISTTIGVAPKAERFQSFAPAED